jgi:hypothetical protein
LRTASLNARRRTVCVYRTLRALSPPLPSERPSRSSRA